MNWIKKIIVSKYAGSILRHIFTAIAGFLAAKGIIEDSAEIEPWINQTTEIILAALIYGVAQVASLAEKTSRDLPK